MAAILEKFRQSPTLMRVGPFAIFLLLTFFQTHFGEAGRYWFYLAKTLTGAWLLWLIWPRIAEMRWKISFVAIFAGIAVFVLWVGLDQIFREWGFKQAPRMKVTQDFWNPFAQFGVGTALAWFFVVVRLAGSTLVVPPLEEVFFRSWLYRYLIRPKFEDVPLGQFRWAPFLITSVVFAVEHQEWIAGIFCGLIFQGLVCWKKRLGDAITAHAITNFLLGVWVIWREAWVYWQ
jgi:uncharacterized protein